MTKRQKRSLRIVQYRGSRSVQGNTLGFQRLKWQLPSDLTQLNKNYLASQGRYHCFYRCMKSYNMDGNNVWISEFGDDDNTEEKVKLFFANMSRQEIVDWAATNKIFWRDGNARSNSAKAYLDNVSDVATYLEYMIKPTYRADGTYESDYMYGVILAEFALGMFHFLDWDYSNPRERQYVLTRSCLIAHYTKLVPNKYANDVQSDVSLLERQRPISISRIDIIPYKDVDHNRVTCEPTKEQQICYASVHSSYVSISEPHSVTDYTIGFSFGPNGFIPIGVSGQGVHSSSDLFELWAGESQSTRPIVNTSKINDFNLNSVNSVMQTGIIDAGSVPTSITAFYARIQNKVLPTSGEYVEVRDIPSRGDYVISNTGNIYKVLSLKGNQYSPYGFSIEVEEGKLH